MSDSSVGVQECYLSKTLCLQCYNCILNISIKMDTSLTVRCTKQKNPISYEAERPNINNFIYLGTQYFTPLQKIC